MHTYSLTYVQSIICFIQQDLVPTSPLGKLHPKPTAVLIVTMVSIRTHSVLKTHSFYGWVGGGVGGCIFLKKGGMSRRGADTPFCTMN